MNRRAWTYRVVAPLRSKCSTGGWPQALGGGWPPHRWPSGLGVTWAHVGPERRCGGVYTVCSCVSSAGCSSVCSVGWSSVSSVASVPSCHPSRWKRHSTMWIPLPLPPLSVAVKQEFPWINSQLQDDELTLVRLGLNLYPQAWPRIQISTDKVAHCHTKAPTRLTAKME
jgi:hypothetical protein